ncbi:hypothetical protein G6L37_07245 [Agrobacterium rubi]|nr:hypothetical protein [Agrobacterium rubi]NTF25162.1 hypothetical protein [Agrobacterium rubi]
MTPSKIKMFLKAAHTSETTFTYWKVPLESLICTADVWQGNETITWRAPGSVGPHAFNVLYCRIPMAEFELASQNTELRLQEPLAGIEAMFAAPVPAYSWIDRDQAPLSERDGSIYVKLDEVSYYKLDDPSYWDQDIPGHMSHRQRLGLLEAWAAIMAGNKLESLRDPEGRNYPDMADWKTSKRIADLLIGLTGGREGLTKHLV